MKKVIVALDFAHTDEAIDMVKQIGEGLEWVKIGMEAFYSDPLILERVQKLNLKVFLDLKLHDIPNTVSKSMNVLSKKSVDMTNVHCLGGSEMMTAAKKAFNHPEQSLLGVTQLTSSSEEQIQTEQGVKESLENSVLRLARLAKNSGLNGIVCSALEVQKIKLELGSDFKCICPGIRFPEDKKSDQKRVVDPATAKQLGCDFIVMGRSITKASDPRQAFLKAKQEFEG
ncbi:MAG: orotidine-5'-phosphate decarboxylase [Bdellovibrionales bacterium]